MIPSQNGRSAGPFSPHAIDFHRQTLSFCLFLLFLPGEMITFSSSNISDPRFGGCRRVCVAQRVAMTQIAATRIAKAYVGASKRNEVSTPAVVHTEFVVPSCPVKFGVTLVVVGDLGGLGGWDPSSGHPLEWSEGDTWRSSKPLEIPVDTAVKFKLVKRSGDDYVDWEDGSDREIVVPKEARKMMIECTWGDPNGTELKDVEEQIDKEPVKTQTGRRLRKRAHKHGGRDQKEDAAEGILNEHAVADASPMDTVQVEEDHQEAVFEQESVGDSPQSIGPSQETNLSSCNIPSGFEDLVERIGVGVDGTLMIVFKDNADNFNAAAIARKENMPSSEGNS